MTPSAFTLRVSASRDTEERSAGERSASATGTFAKHTRRVPPNPIWKVRMPNYILVSDLGEGVPREDDDGDSRRIAVAQLGFPEGLPSLP